MTQEHFFVRKEAHTVAHAVYLPVVSRPLARRQMMVGGKPAAHMQQVAFTQNVENARDIVVRAFLSC